MTARPKPKRAEDRRTRAGAPRARPARAAEKPKGTTGERRALSHVGGRVTTEGDPALAASLERALSVRSDDAATRAHVHGFHSYAARMHPATAARLIEALSAPGQSLLDPFCGSGTVLVEARLAGRRAFGVDANPLSIELSRLKTEGLDAAQRGELLAAAGRVAEHADTRRRQKAGPTKRYGPADREVFEVHVLLELDGLRDGIAKEHAPGNVKRALQLVLSAILTKVSRQPGDTANDRIPRRLGAGYTLKLFTRKAEELAQRLEDYEAALPGQTFPAKVTLGDARNLRAIKAVAPASIDLMVTSPPYPGVYDYTAHHAMRLRWLDLDVQKFERTELGARRRLGALPFARALGLWERELGEVLGEWARVLAAPGGAQAGGRAAVLIADSVVADRAVYADQLVEKLAPKHGLTVRAQAAQARPHFHADTRDAFAECPRREHVIVLEKSGAGPPGAAANRAASRRR